MSDKALLNKARDIIYNYNICADPDIDALDAALLDILALKKVDVPRGYAIVPLEADLETVMVGENAFDAQISKRIDSEYKSVWPSEEKTELAARVAYREMIKRSCITWKALKKS